MSESLSLPAATAIERRLIEGMREKNALLDECAAVLERIIAAQGDAAEPALVRLQHRITETLNP